MAWPLPSTSRYSLPSPSAPELVGRREHDSHHVARAGSLLDRRPRRALLAHAVELLVDLVLRHGTLGPLDAESRGSGQSDLGADLEAQLEREWLALLELEVVHVGLPDRLELLPADRFLVGLLHERLRRPAGESLRRTACAPRPAAPCPGENPGAGRSTRSGGPRALRRPGPAPTGR